MTFEFAKEIVSKMDAEKKEALYLVTGKTLVTGKKQPTPKVIYSTLSADEKKAFKFFIDRALF